MSKNSECNFRRNALTNVKISVLILQFNLVLVTINSNFESLSLSYYKIFAKRSL